MDAPADIARWRAMPLTTLRKRADLGVAGGEPSRWVTRAGAGVDGAACRWLLRRFVDPRAEVASLPAADVQGEAARHGAVVFDVPGAPIASRGTRSSFDALLDAFDLRDPALLRMAAIVRGAETGLPESAGLRAVVTGLARLHAGDESALYAAALAVYDALYAGYRPDGDAGAAA